MSDEGKTNIQWTDYTWNPWVGCNWISAGCDNCYMFSEQRRRNINPEKVRRTTTTFDKPLKKDRQKNYKIEAGSNVFVCSYSDFFHPLADEWRDEAWAIIKQRPDVIFQIVTKRTSDLASRLPADWGDGYPNVWLIVSVENTAMLPRIDKLLDIPAAVRGVSYEPALEYVDFGAYLLQLENSHTNLDWIIVGGESGDNARPFQIDWARKTVKDCKDSGVACFVKQMGSVAMQADEHVLFFDKKGGDIEEWPEELRVQQFPEPWRDK